MSSLAMLLIPAMAFSLSAQNIAFKVLAKKGMVTINAGGKSTAWENLGTGYEIYATEKIKLEGNSYISLVHPANGRALELKTAGTYAVSDLLKKATAQKSGAAEKYISYVGRELSKVNEPVNPGEKHQSNMGTTGSVERAFGDNVTEVEVTESVVGSAFGMLNIPAEDYANTVRRAVETVRIKIPLPKSSYIIDSTVTFAWHSVSGAEEYIVSLTDDEGRSLFEMSARDTFLTVNLSEYTLDKERCYNWRVSSTGEFIRANSQDNCIMQMNFGQQSKVRATTAELLKEFSEDTPLKALALGHFYEENQLYLNALEQFRKAGELEPEIDEYRLAYARFLERNGLEEQAVVVRKK